MILERFGGPRDEERPVFARPNMLLEAVFPLIFCSNGCGVEVSASGVAVATVSPKGQRWTEGTAAGGFSTLFNDTKAMRAPINGYRAALAISNL